MSDDPLSRVNHRGIVPGLWKTWLFQVLTILAFLYFGLAARAFTWNSTRHIHWTLDLRNALYWGTRVCSDGASGNGEGANTDLSTAFRGLRGIYDKERLAPDPLAPIALDYAPLRLVTVTLWSQYVRTHVDHAVYSRQIPTAMLLELASPLLDPNVACALLTAVGTFYVVRLWAERDASAFSVSSLAASQGATRRAAIAAVLVWLNPALILDSHAWPQWDVWCAPFFVWSIYLGGIGAWTRAGFLLVIGAFFKGQMLLVAPVIALWSLGYGVSACARFVVGGLVAISGTTAIWLLPSIQAWAWVAGLVAVAAAVSLPTWQRFRSSVGTKVLSLAVTLILAGLPVFRAPSVFACVAAAIAWTWAVIPFAFRTQVYDRVSGARRPLAVFAIASLCAAMIFGGSFGWLVTGFISPTDQYRVMSFSASNLSAILQSWCAWDVSDRIGPLSVRTLLRGIFAVLLFNCAAAAVFHAGRGHSQQLAALVAPWIFAFAFLPQMQERYFVWAAIFTPLTLAVSYRGVLIHLIVTTISCYDILRKLASARISSNDQWYEVIQSANGWQTGAGCITLALGLLVTVFVWQSPVACDRPSQPIA